MIKLGKACSQLMKANNTGETNIKVVGNIFRLTTVFNALKPSLNLCLSSPIALNLFLIFEIRGVLSIKTCLGFVRLHQIGPGLGTITGGDRVNQGGSLDPAISFQTSRGGGQIQVFGCTQ
jgi:hypothetical protein